MIDTDGNILYRTELDYDAQNRPEGFGEMTDGNSFKTTYTYDNDNRVTETGFGGDEKVRYTYDGLGRVSERVSESGTEIGEIATAYTYADGGHGDGSTTALVEKIEQPHIPFEYTYDDRGNIVSEKRGSLTTTYAYDALGQLVRVNDPHGNATWIYSYDLGGNIVSKAKYAYTTGEVGTPIETVPYVYGDTNWKDKLTGYDGQSITYDEIGNPLNDGTWTYTWGAGRQLRSLANNNTGNRTYYSYNSDGLRVGKTWYPGDWYPEVTGYIYHNKVLTHMTVDYHDGDEEPQRDEAHFFYDAQNRPAKVKFNGVMYTYLHNLQGDIVGIVDNAGALVVEYKYDAWGRKLSVTGSLSGTLGRRNPFRYRGYVWDEETGLYYLRSRYYTPKRERFVMADNCVSHSKALLESNLFAYCFDTPINAFDYDGRNAYWITDSSNVGGMGHTSLLVQDEDKWFYFYWGPNLEQTELYAKVYYVEVEISEDDVLGSINSMTDKTEYGGVYDSAILFEGDFKKTAEYCVDLRNRVEKTGLPAYGVVDNNCMQVSAKAMKSSYTWEQIEYWVFRQVTAIVVPTIAQGVINWIGKETIIGSSGPKGLVM